jgi:hypothetical protein
MSPPSEVFSDENDIEKNDDNESTTFSIDDDDECVIEDVDDDDYSDEDSVEHRMSIKKMFHEVNDDDNYNIHDQLPSVEEVKSSNAYLPTARLLAQSHRRKIYLTIAAAAFAAMVLSVSISVGVFKRTTKKAYVHESRLEDVIQYIFTNNISELPLLRISNTAERHAAQFIADGDAYHMAMSDVSEVEKQRFLERYVLSLLYYQTSGDKWTQKHNFLSKLDHCNWHTKYSNPMGHFMSGVQCNDDGLVVDLDLCK